MAQLTWVKRIKPAMTNPLPSASNMALQRRGTLVRSHSFGSVPRHQDELAQHLAHASFALSTPRGSKPVE